MTERGRGPIAPAHQRRDFGVAWENSGGLRAFVLAVRFAARHREASDMAFIVDLTGCTKSLRLSQRMSIARQGRRVVIT